MREERMCEAAEPPMGEERMYEAAEPPMDEERMYEAAEPPMAGQVPVQAFAEPQKITALELNHLRNLRAEVQDLQEILTQVRTGKVKLSMYAKYIQQTRAAIEALICDLSDGDTVRHIRNQWEQMSVCPLLTEPEVEYEAQLQLQYLNLLDKQINKIVYWVGARTIPARVNDWLAGNRVGYPIPFHAMFKDEVPDADARTRILNLLAWSPDVIQQGLVDVDNGVIYRYEVSPGASFRSIGLLLLGFALATIIVAGIAYPNVPGWPFSPANLGTMLLAWGAVLCGVVVHVAVEQIKHQQQRALPQVVALGDLPNWINARLGQLLFKLLLALIGCLGLLFGAGVGSTTVFNAFLVGYSLDSFVGLFGASLEQQAGAHATRLGQQLGVVEAG